MLQARGSHSVTAELTSERFLGKASKGNGSKEETRLRAFFLLPAKKPGSYKFTETLQKNKTQPRGTDEQGASSLGVIMETIKWNKHC